MKITVTAERPSNDQVVANISVSAKDVDKAIAAAYKDIAKKYAFQGFRRGRAPRPVVDSLVGRNNVLAQATEDLMNEVQPLMLEELDLVPVDRPDYGDEPLAVVEHEDFSATATISVPPVCELDSYDAPAINMPPEEATEAEIDEQIDQLASYRTTFEDDDEDRAVVEGDHVVCDLENKENAPEFNGEGRQLSLSATYLPQGLVDGIIGMKKGDTKEISWVHGEGDDAHNHVVVVTLKGLKKLVTPEIDDEFAKGMGFDTVAELRDAVKEEIAESKKHELPSLKEDRVVEEIGKHLSLEEVPEAYQNQVYNELANEILQQVQRQNMSLDMYLAARGIKFDDFIKDLHEQAEERARQSLALDALARKLEFDASDEDVQREFENAQVKDVKQSIADFTKSGQMPAIRESIRRTKAVNWLVENATVSVVDEAAERKAAKDSE